MDKLIVFHVDMNMGKFSRAYLEKWLSYLAGKGYNAILWEVENHVRWDTVPESIFPEAFTKEEFREIVDFSRNLGLEPIPLFQTIGHAEYVLKHEPYVHLRELPDKIDQYCPLHPEVVPMLRKWIGEYLDVFSDIRFFHLGADEAWFLGKCPKCSAFSEEHSRSRLYVDHINKVAEPVFGAGIRPAIWCDMILHYPEAMDELSDQFLIFDWEYNLNNSSDRVRIWGAGERFPEKLTERESELFGKFILPQGQGGKIQVQYTLDFLKAKGFDVISCPSSSSFGDNVFSPLQSRHEPNTWDFARNGLERADGVCLTSWSVHLHPWEMQKSCIDMVPFLAANPDADLETFRKTFVRDTFGEDTQGFLQVQELLEQLAPYTFTRSLGFHKSCLTIPGDFILNTVRELHEKGDVAAELEKARKALDGYEKGMTVLSRIRQKADAGSEYLDVWELMGRVLVHRAQADIFLFSPASEQKDDQREHLLQELDALRAEVEALYTTIHLPIRGREITGWMFTAFRYALEYV